VGTEFLPAVCCRSAWGVTRRSSALCRQAARRYGRRKRRLRSKRISSRAWATTASNGGLWRWTGLKSRRRRWLAGRSSDGMSSRATRSCAKSSSSRSPGVLSAGASRTATKTSAKLFSSWSRDDLIERTMAASATMAAASPATPPTTVQSSVNVSASGTNEVLLAPWVWWDRVPTGVWFIQAGDNRAACGRRWRRRIAFPDNRKPAAGR